MKFPFAIRHIALLATASLVVTPAAAAVPACKAESGRQTAPLVELTSGVATASPGSRREWGSPEAMRTTAPFTFHVDYWDRLDWKDRFAAAAWTKRQYDRRVLRSMSSYAAGAGGTRPA